ncbi:hypothetical protein CBD41_07650 [bacterium TMED181]|nr:hypothetical protein [Planctomycetota bacterium]OUW43153.1 MAG: hypothetical protein CBD41_07650 [bacterium TMED181]
MSSSFDVPKAVDKRLSTMAVEDLAKRGMRTVKVLDKASIMSLIDEAVETVVADRLAELKADDRDRLREEAKTQFKKLVQERNSRQKEQQNAYEERIENLRAQAVSLEEKLEQSERERDEITVKVGPEETHEAVETVEVPASSLDADQIKDVVREAVAEAKSEATAPSESQMSDLKASIDALVTKVTNGHTAGSTKNVEPPSEEALVALFSRESNENVENNLDQVEVKNTKVGGVSANLAKLKNLHKETE